MSANELDPMLISIFRNELAFQSEQVLIAVEDLNRCLEGSQNDTRFWYSLTGALNAMANIGNILWPQQNRKGSKRRAELLRQHLGLGPDSVLALHEVRNGFAHFDERIDEWHATSERRNFADRNIAGRTGIVGLDEGDFARNYDPEGRTISVFGKRLDFQGAVNDVTSLRGILVQSPTT